MLLVFSTKRIGVSLTQSRLCQLDLVYGLRERLVGVTSRELVLESLQKSVELVGHDWLGLLFWLWLVKREWSGSCLVLRLRVIHVRRVPLLRSSVLKTNNICIWRKVYECIILICVFSFVKRWDRLTLRYHIRQWWWWIHHFSPTADISHKVVLTLLIFHWISRSVLRYLSLLLDWLILHKMAIIDLMLLLLLRNWLLFIENQVAMDLILSK